MLTVGNTKIFRFPNKILITLFKHIVIIILHLVIYLFPQSLREYTTGTSATTNPSSATASAIVLSAPNHFPYILV